MFASGLRGRRQLGHPCGRCLSWPLRAPLEHTGPERWRYMPDNLIVKHWLQSRQSGVRAGRLLVRLANLVEI